MNQHFSLSLVKTMYQLSEDYRYLAKLFFYQRASKNRRYDLHILRFRVAVLFII